jgi:hypothetical protein
VLLAGAVAADVCAHWLALIEQRYAAVERLHDEPDFSVHSSSLRLRAVPEIALEDVLRAVVRGKLARHLGDFLVCDADQCWIRRQYAPRHAPPQHAPHSWHQDGALNFDFSAHAGASLPADALLQMFTCWITLTPCGDDAPGLEWVAQPTIHMLGPPELTDERVRRSFAAQAIQRPTMKPGDALLLRGDTLHRTHVTPAMTRDRTSIELRFFPTQPLPERLRGDRLVLALTE